MSSSRPRRAAAEQTNTRNRIIAEADLKALSRQGSSGRGSLNAASAPIGRQSTLPTALNASARVGSGDIVDDTASRANTKASRANTEASRASTEASRANTEASRANTGASRATSGASRAEASRAVIGANRAESSRAADANRAGDTSTVHTANDAIRASVDAASVDNVATRARHKSKSRRLNADVGIPNPHAEVTNFPVLTGTTFSRSTRRMLDAVNEILDSDEEVIDPPVPSPNTAAGASTASLKRSRGPSSDGPSKRRRFVHANDTSNAIDTETPNTVTLSPAKVNAVPRRSSRPKSTRMDLDWSGAASGSEDGSEFELQADRHVRKEDCKHVDCKCPTVHDADDEDDSHDHDLAAAHEHDYDDSGSEQSGIEEADLEELELEELHDLLDAEEAGKSGEAAPSDSQLIDDDYEDDPVLDDEDCELDLADMSATVAPQVRRQPPAEQSSVLVAKVRPRRSHGKRPPRGPLSTIYRDLPIVQPGRTGDKKVDRFQMWAWRCLQAMKTSATSWPNMKLLPRKFRPMTIGSWAALSRVRLEFLYSLFIKGVPLSIQRICGQTSWLGGNLYEALEALPRLRDEDGGGDMPGLYIFYDPVLKESYIGLSQRPKIERASEHAEEVLQPNGKQTAVYKHFRQPSAIIRFRCLANYEYNSIADGYLTIFESAWMIILNTYQRVGYYGRTNPECTYDFVEHIRSEAGLPEAPHRGLNRALSIWQGWKNGAARTESACINPECSTMTFPGMHKGPKHLRRVLANADDPLNCGYHCNDCHLYQLRLGALPDREKLNTLRMVREARKTLREARANGTDVRCDWCQSVENPATDKPFGASKDLPGKTLCFTCSSFHSQAKRKNLRGRDRVRTPQDQLRLEVHRAIRAQHRNGETVSCYKCKKVLSKGQTMFIRSDGALCNTCRSSEQKKKASEMRSPAGFLQLKAVRKLVSAAKANKTNLTCYNCNKSKPADSDGSFRSKTPGPFCRACASKDAKDRKKAGIPTQAAINRAIRRRFQEEYEAAKARGEDVQCCAADCTSMLSQNPKQGFKASVIGMLCCRCDSIGMWYRNDEDVAM